ncbi:MAG TPA: MoaD/ThiS family protein [Candidatus Bathyarchaeota archaeon]|nr:MoaD/ThiS family protein [Candidatus Bathyarchaeota archaeon]
MNVRVQYFGYIKNMLNKKEEQYELEEGASLSDLLNKLADVHGEAFRKEVYEPGLEDVKMGFSVTVNGVFIGQLDRMDTKLADGDNVILMSLMSGG